ncbi:RHS repeat-associated core domain-containing protein, partial [Burkholderia diffusa]|uniref:RHS repeat domain-containing protein n=1 Tax=Burkholderia diffusa TaxID=488732 RepID=UPI002ABDAEC1
RLLESIGPAGKERFAFDPASNIIDPARVETARKESRPSPVRAESSLPLEVPKVLGNLLKQYAGRHFEYDARGNLVHRRSPAGEQRYEWNAFNRMTAASVQETARNSESRYYYDALGRRIAKEVNGERTVFGWDGDTLAYESGEHGSTHYLYEAESFVPMVQYVGAPVSGCETPSRGDTDRYVPEDDPLQRVPERAGQVHAFYYHCDQIGTPQVLTDDDGDVVWEASYKAWGEAREVIARASRAVGIAPRNSLRFQGQQFDDETGLHYNRYRYYDPSSGRFVSRDPIGLAGGVNVYQYAPNPISWIDPLGLAKRGPKTGGCGPHNEMIAAWGQEVADAGGIVIAGGGVEKEVLVGTPGGFKGGRRPDIIYTDSDGKTIFGNVGKVRADGVTPVKREEQAMDDLRTKTTGKNVPDDVQFRAYNCCPCKGK